MKNNLTLIARLLIIIISIAWVMQSLQRSVVILGHCENSQPKGEWQFESLNLNFIGADVAPGGTTVIAGGYDNGAIYRSVDEGATWTQVATLPGFKQIWTVYCDSRGFFFASLDYSFQAGAHAGLYRSTDDGITWTRVWYYADNIFVHSSGICEDENGVLYIGTYGWPVGLSPTIFKSTDGGSTWSPIASFGEGHIHCLRYNPSTGKMWVWVGDPGYAGYGFYWSADKGVTWNKTSITNSTGSMPGWNIMSFEPYGNYIFFTRHWDYAQLYRADFTETNGIPPSNPPVVEVWRGGFDRLNWVRRYKNWMLCSGEAHANQPAMKIGGSYTSPYGLGTWATVYTDGVSTGDGGFACASHHWSRNGWFFVSNTITGKGMRMRFIPSVEIGDVVVRSVSDPDQVSSTDPWTTYYANVSVTVNGTLADLQNITWVFNCTGTAEDAVDNVTNHYTFNWTPIEGFREPVLSGHLITSESRNESLSSSSGWFRLAFRFGKSANAKMWTCRATVYVEDDVFSSKKTPPWSMNTYIGISLSSSTVEWNCYPGCVNASATPMPLNISVASNVKLEIQIRGGGDLRSSGDFTLPLSNVYVGKTNSTHDNDGILLITTYQVWEADIEPSENTNIPSFWFLTIPLGTPAGEYSFTFYVKASECQT